MPKTVWLSVVTLAACGRLGYGELTLDPDAGADVAVVIGGSSGMGGMQIGGGVNVENACQLLEIGASHVIVTSWVFREGRLDWDRLGELVRVVGKDRLVLDLSCRRRGEDYVVVTDRWQKFTELVVSAEVLERCR